MNKIILYIIGCLCLFSSNQFFSQHTISYTSSSDADNLGVILNDGDYGSTDISGLQVDIITIDELGNPLGTSLYWLNEPTDNISGVGTAPGWLNVNGTSGLGISIKSNNGVEFDFDGFKAQDFQFNGNKAIVVEGYKDGSMVGSVTLNGLSDVATIFSSSDLTGAIFDDVDEVRILPYPLGSGTGYRGGFNGFKINYTPSSPTEPVFENTTPNASSIATTSFTLNTDINEAGSIYYVVLPDGSSSPTSVQVKAGTDASSAAPVTSGSQVVSIAGFTHNFNVTGLTIGTSYDVYVVAEDDESSPNLQASPSKIDVVTLPPNPNMTKNDIVVLQFNTNGGDDEFALLALSDISAGQVFYVSDGSWDVTTSNFSSIDERAIKVTVNASGIDAGAILRFDNTGSGQIILQDATQANLEYFDLVGATLTGTARTLNLGATGDQLVIFQTADGVVTSNPTFIYAFNGNDGGTSDGWDSSASTIGASQSSSHVPTALTALNSVESNRATANAFGIAGIIATGEINNYQYSGPTTAATRDDWITRIHTTANWISENGTPYSNDVIASGAGSVIVSGTLSFDDVSLEKVLVNIFPNPFNNILYFNSTNAKIEKALLYDLLGKSILNIDVENGKINTSSITSGLYLIKIETDKGTMVKKLIKN